MPKKDVPFILTNHAKERMVLRRISRDMIAQTLNTPDRTEIEPDGDTEHIRILSGRQVHVIARYEADEQKWLIKSTWVRGEKDAAWQKWLTTFFSWLMRFLQQKRKSR